MIGFPKTLTDFSKYKPSNYLREEWKNSFENQAQFYLDNQHFFSKKTENWKYFPFQKVMKQNFVFGKANSSLLKTEDEPLLPSSLLISVKNGKPSFSFKPTDHFFLCSWKDFLHSKVDLDFKIKQKIFLSLKKQRNPFCSLNNTLYEDGFILIVKKSLKKVLEIHYRHSDTNELQGLNLRNFIFIENEASAQIIEFFYGREEKKPLFLNVQTDCFIGKKAQLEHSRIDRAEKQDTIINQFFSELSKSAKACFFSLSLNAGIGRWMTELEQAEKSISKIRGLSLLGGNRHADHKVNVLHKGIEGISHQLYKSFLFDSAKQIFQGLISINKEAQKSNTNQLSKNFLFSKKAFAVTSPELDITADDVKACHGATVSPFTENKNLIFYLKSRGINSFQALQLVLSGLVEEVFSCLQANTQSVVKSFLQQNLNSLEKSIKEVLS